MNRLIFGIVILIIAACETKSKKNDFLFKEKQYSIDNDILKKAFDEMKKINSLIQNKEKIRKVEERNLSLYYYDDLIKASVFNHDPLSTKFNTCYYFFDNKCIVSLNTFEESTIYDYKLYFYENDSLLSCLVKNRNNEKYYNTITTNQLTVAASEKIINFIKELRVKQ